MTETYFHGFSLDNWYPVWNIKITKRLYSVDCADEKANTDGYHTPIRDLPISEIEKMNVFTGFAASRLLNIINHKRKWDLEIRLEKVRRVISPDAPCRMSCLYLSDNPKDINDMLPEYYVCKVKIIYKKNFLKVDPRWVEEYYEKDDFVIAMNYWSGKSFDESSPRWEYLLDGTIEFIDENEIDFIKHNGKRVR